MGHWSGALAASILASAAAWRLGALSASGALAAVLVGTLVTGFGGWSWAALLVLFVAAASLSSALPPQPQAPRRSARQVLANGGVACLAAAAYGLFPIPGFAAAFAGALATAWADTWATEFGVRYGGRPRRLWGLDPVEPGASGGVTVLGTAAGLVAAGLCGLVAAALGVAPAGTTTLAGAVGMMVDSLMGATLEAEFRCPRCGRPGETARCSCGGQARRIRGMKAWGGGWTNFLATGTGAAAALWWVLRRSVA